ncbi:MAG: hypothetical protein LBU68_01010 [Rickettsiales bacterium]|nr:hypothetical protein [Rickettsiales bacterium]
MNKNTIISPQILRTKKLQNLRRIFLMAGALLTISEIKLLLAQEKIPVVMPSQSDANCVSKCNTSYAGNATSTGGIFGGPSSYIYKTTTPYSYECADSEGSSSTCYSDTVTYYNYSCSTYNHNNAPFTYVVPPAKNGVSGYDNVCRSNLLPQCIASCSYTPVAYVLVSDVQKYITQRTDDRVRELAREVIPSSDAIVSGTGTPTFAQKLADTINAHGIPLYDPNFIAKP